MAVLGTEFLSGPGTRAMVEDAGRKVAEQARRLAPVGATGVLSSEEGITYEMAEENGQPVCKVGWTPRAFYGYFVEMGTVKMAPESHLRPALALA